MNNKSLFTSITNLIGATEISRAKVEMYSTTKRTDFNRWRSDILRNI